MSESAWDTVEIVKDNKNASSNKESAHSHTNQVQGKPYLIIDTNAFLKCLDFPTLLQKYEVLTTNGVLKEIRDQRARLSIEPFLNQIQKRESSERSQQFVKKFAVETGDFSSLSAVDLDFIALAHTLIEQNGKTHLLNKKPRDPVNYFKQSQQNDHEQSDPVQDEEGTTENIEEDSNNADDGWVVVSKSKKTQSVKEDIKPKSVKTVTVPKQLQTTEQALRESEQKPVQQI